MMILVAAVLGACLVYSQSTRNEYASQKPSQKVVATKYGDLRGVEYSFKSKQFGPVAVYKGVPYASSPTGNLRFMPPVSPPLWSGTKLADRFGPVCHQKLPDVSSESASLKEMSRKRFEFFRKVLPLLKNQSEDCLYLNIYVPVSDGFRNLSVMVFIHGGYFEWGAGSIYDGSIIASLGKIIFVTLNYRLGIFGFLKTGGKSDQTGNFGILDQVAALQWISENIDSFGGDRAQITVLGHEAGASLVNLLVISPLTKGKFALLSGSALSPWSWNARQADVAAALSSNLNCTADSDARILQCLRSHSSERLLRSGWNSWSSLPSFAPFFDDSVVAADPEHVMMKRGGVFKEGELLAGVTICESCSHFSNDDMLLGIDGSRMRSLLRSFVNSTFRYHRNEIFAAILNEYTQWEASFEQPHDVRDSLGEVLTDGCTVSQLVKVLNIHSMRDLPTYFFVFGHEQDLVSKKMSPCTEDLIPYLFGHVWTGGIFLQKNVTKADVDLSEALITYFANFAKSGDPNKPSRVADDHMDAKEKSKEWPAYDAHKQRPAAEAEVKDHYRSHKLSLWLHLLPIIHVPGGKGIPAEHHQILSSSPDLFGGFPRSTFDSRFVPPSSSDSAAASHDGDRADFARGSLKRLTDEAQLSVSSLAEALLRSFSTALVVITTIGCTLLVLNLLICGAVYCRRDRSEGKSRQQELDRRPEALGPMPGIVQFHPRANPRNAAASPPRETLNSMTAYCDIFQHNFCPNLFDADGEISTLSFPVPKCKGEKLISSLKIEDSGVREAQSVKWNDQGRERAKHQGKQAQALRNAYYADTLQEVQV